MVYNGSGERMTSIKKNIWLTFYITATIWLLFFGAATYVSYQTVYDEYTAEQKKLMTLTSNSLQSLFRQYEVLLDLITKEMKIENGLPDKRKAQAIMDTIIDVDPSMVGVGLFTPDGEAYVASSGITLPPKFNILAQKENRESFLRTLKEEHMVLGRTYQSKVLNTIAFPLRKAMRDKDGKVVFVLSTVVDLNKAFDFLINKKNTQFSSDLYIFREHDHYFQMVLTKGLVDPSIYSYQIPDSERSRAIESLESELGISYQTIKDKELDIIIDSHQPTLDANNPSDENTKAVSKYIPDYGLWVEAKIDDASVRSLFLNKAKTLIIVFVGSLLFIFILFRGIAISEQRKKAALQYQANHDYLTELHNRYYLDQQLVRSGTETPFFMIFIDLDNFKAINDGYGHELGDKVLKSVAQRLKVFVSDSDLLIRYSGDEFIIVVYNEIHQTIVTRCENILSSFEQPCVIDDYSFVLSASIGVAAYPEDGTDLDELKRYADLAMYESKKTRNTITFFQEDFREAYKYRAQMEQELKQAIVLDEFYMVYQPQIMRNGGLFGVEALVRWENKTLGMVPPDKFIPVAESSGAILAIGDFIIERSFQDIVEVQRDTGINISVSINISIKQFQHKHFLDKLVKLIEKHAFIYVELVLEVTENLFIDDVIGIQAIMHKIKSKGIRISLDDFGTGYSSLSLLSHLPIDELKIDKSFISEITTDPKTRAMVEGIIAIAQQLNFTTVVEGVETEEQRQILQSLECDIFQGYHFSKPLKVHDLKTFIQSPTVIVSPTPPGISPPDTSPPHNE
ncbi:EAL domain-containing protein [Marinomonas mediterranea]|nr:EAL domain-containing protein [Marinomonas mediterranea]